MDKPDFGSLQYFLVKDSNENNIQELIPITLYISINIFKCHRKTISLRTNCYTMISLQILVDTINYK